MADYKGKHSRELLSDTSLPDKLNYFHARFEASNTEKCMRASAVPDDCVITSAAMKCFERLIMALINTIISETLEPLQFAYRPNRSTDDAITIALHDALSHMDKRNTYVRMLFIDYSFAFNTIVPVKAHH